MERSMRKYDIDRVFSELTASVEQEHEQKRVDAFSPEARPIPEGLVRNGIPLGHIALRGDFEPTVRLRVNDEQCDGTSNEL